MNGRYTRRRIKGGSLADILIAWMLRRNKELKQERFQKNALKARIAKQASRRTQRSANKHEADRTIGNIGSFLQRHENSAEASLERIRHERQEEIARQARDEVLIKQIAKQINTLEKAYSKINDIHVNANAAPDTQLEYLTAELDGYVFIKPTTVFANIRRLQEQLSDTDYKQVVNRLLEQLEHEINATHERYTELMRKKTELEKVKRTQAAQELQEERRRQKSAERKARRATTTATTAAAAATEPVKKSGLEQALELQAARNRERQEKKVAAEAAQAQIVAARRAEEEARKESAARKASAARKKELQSAFKRAATAAATKATNIDAFKTYIDSLIVKTEKEDSEKLTYNGHMSIMLRDEFIQNVILKLISNIHNEIYNKSVDKIKLGLNGETVAKFTSEINIKNDLYKLFIKGGAASTLLFRQRTTAGTKLFPFTNDIDCVLLINPSLPSKEYKQLQVNLIQCIINVIEDFITKTQLPSHVAIEDNKITPQVYKYYNELYPAYDGPKHTEETALPKLLDTYATKLQTSPFPSLYSKHIQIKENAPLAAQLQEIMAQKQPLQARLMEISQTIQRIQALFVQNQQLAVQLQAINIQELNFIYFPQHPTLAMLRQQKYNILQQMLNPVAQQQEQQTLVNALEEQRLIITQLTPLNEQSAQLEERIAVLNRVQTSINEFHDSYKVKTFTYNTIFNAGYIKDNTLHLLQQSIISVRPKTINKKYELFDIIIPFKKNAHLEEEWSTYKTQEFTDTIPELQKDILDILYDIDNRKKTPIRFDIETIETAILDQMYAIKGTPETLADKLANRKRRLKYLTARLVKGRCADKSGLQQCVVNLRKEFPELFNDFGVKMPTSFGGGSTNATRKLPRWFKAQKN